MRDNDFAGHSALADFVPNPVRFAHAPLYRPLSWYNLPKSSRLGYDKDLYIFEGQVTIGIWGMYDVATGEVTFL
jgi:hypothetical protein